MNTQTVINAEFDCPFTVTADGTVGPSPEGIYAPETTHDDMHDMLIDGIQHVHSLWWEALTGYTGQYSYHGPVMHASEYLGGRLAADVLANPGVYVLTVVNVLPDDDDSDPEPAGWAILRLREICKAHS